MSKIVISIIEINSRQETAEIMSVAQKAFQ